MVALSLLAFCAVMMVGAVIREQHISRNLSAREAPTWEQVLYRLKAVPTQGLQEMASRHPPSQLLPEETVSAYLRIGGQEGLRRLLNNSPVIVDLASCSRDWRSSEGLKSAAVERIRHADIRLTLLARLSTLLIKCGSTGSHTDMCLKAIAEIYCTMVNELIELYSETHVGRVDQLVAACNWPARVA